MLYYLIQKRHKTTSGWITWNDLYIPEAWHEEILAVAGDANGTRFTSREEAETAMILAVARDPSLSGHLRIAERWGR
jgi:hypothetical protein